VNKKVFIIAEIGPNHNGSEALALKMVRKLKFSGVDSIKFQLGNPYKVYSKNAFKADYQKNNDPYLNIVDMAKSYQLTHQSHLKIAKFCKKNNIIYSCTAFDLESLKFLDKIIKIPFFKIASGEVFSLDMLDYISKQNKPILLSTGMTNFAQIKKIIKILNKKKKKKITIMHCVSAYPAKKKNLNLNIIDEIKKRFKNNVGYSDHSLGNDACLIAVSKGAKVIEKHVTISKKLIGPDHKSSATINQFKKLIKDIRKYEEMLGSNKKNFQKDELHIHNVARKSIATARKIFKNKKITLNDLCFRRPGTGISPFKINDILGKKPKFNLDHNILIKKSFLKS
jgi:N,N'-diacetyllegionaminate synthase